MTSNTLSALQAEPAGQLDAAVMAKYTRIPIAEITAMPNGLVMAYRDYWWVITPDEEVLRYRETSMQCNPHRAIVERLAPKGCTVRQLPIAFIKVNVSDFA